MCFQFAEATAFVWYIAATSHDTNEEEDRDISVSDNDETDLGDMYSDDEDKKIVQFVFELMEVDDTR